MGGSMSKGLIMCREALERLKNGKPNNDLFKGVPITASIVSQEAGFDSGYLKKSRHAEFIDEISAVKENLDGQKKVIARKKYEKVERGAIAAESDAKRYKKMLDDALTREIRLIRRVRELESDIEFLNT